MKKFCLALAVSAIALVGLGMNGCQKEEKAAGTPTVQQTPQQQSVDPASQKPKDHPAH